MLLPSDTLVRTDDDLHKFWLTLRGDLPFSDLALWILVIDPEGLPGPLMAVADLPDGPYDLSPDELEGLLGELVRQQPGNSAALLYARPGAEPWHIGDRAWSRFLQLLRFSAEGTHWPVYRARDGILEPCPVP